MSSLISARAALGRYPMLLHAINPFPSVMMRGYADWSTSESASTSENTLPSRNRPPSRDNLTSTPLSYKEYRNRNKARISRPDQPTYDTLVFVIQLLNRGAPKMAGDISMLTQGQVGAWIQQVLEETELDTQMPATKGQIALARHMVADGAPNADQVHDGMSRREVTEWISAARKMIGYHRPPPVVSHAQRREPATENQLEYAEKLAARAGMTPPYDRASAKFGGVSDFILRCKKELHRKGIPVRRPTEEERGLHPTEGQLTRLTKLGIQLPLDATRGHASDLIEEAQSKAGATWKAVDDQNTGTARSEKAEAEEGVEDELEEEAGEWDPSVSRWG